MTVKELLKDSKKEILIKTHIRSVGNGIAGFYSPAWLIEHYGECECYIEEYEKDYGDGLIDIRRFLQIEDIKEEIENE